MAHAASVAELQTVARTCASTKKHEAILYYSAYDGSQTFTMEYDATYLPVGLDLIRKWDEDTLFGLGGCKHAPGEELSCHFWFTLTRDPKP
eukprot:CAMPEP_0179316956 /NCGR_PEP_ID=MMETSP0797-20121207/55986_1 /TAXON_ID=47934 /ORGANISM="Dinophysis acuminata, Strain DAEP01" /LENGTH=90 /DNA_ID=CAMNT_0021027811 /DNA_START=9 /DNA_END=277 /DNA_ORIENTATION=-